jgi:cell division protease FtsH
LIKKAYRTAKSVLEEHLDLLHALAELLLEQETVLGNELDQLITSLKPDVDLPERPEENLETYAEKETGQSARCR